jgi:hypothetical protein
LGRWYKRDEGGMLTEYRRKKVDKQIKGEGDALDSSMMLASISIIVFMISFGFLIWALIVGIVWNMSIPWVLALGFLMLNSGVTIYWAVERSGYHVKAGPHKYAPFNLEFMDWVEISVEDRKRGFKLTALAELIRTHGLANWWRSHGGKTKPYIVAIVPGTERRFRKNKENDWVEVGPDWKTPIDDFERIRENVIKNMEGMQHITLCLDEDDNVVLYDETNKKIPQDVKTWEFNLFPTHMELIKNGGKMTETSEHPGKAGVWWGSDYLLFGDFNRVPNDRIKFDVKVGLERDRPYFQDYTYALISETAFPWIGPVQDFRPADFRVIIEDARQMQNYYAQALRKSGETTRDYAYEMSDLIPRKETYEFPTEEREEKK